jgi:hypothetical protein
LILAGGFVHAAKHASARMPCPAVLDNDIMKQTSSLNDQLQV